MILSTRRRSLPVLVSIAMAAGLGLVGSSPARAADVWTYSGWFTLDGVFRTWDPSLGAGQAAQTQIHQLDISVDQLRVEDGRIVDGFVMAKDCAAYPRGTGVRFNDPYGCTGTIIFGGLGTPSLSITSVDLQAPANDLTFSIDYSTPPRTSIAGTNVSPARKPLPPLVPSVLSVTAGTVDPVASTMLVQVGVSLPPSYPAGTLALTLASPGGMPVPYPAGTWQAIPCGVATAVDLTVTGTDTDPPTQSTSTSYTPNCAPRVPTLRLTTQAVDSATLAFSLSDGGPVESATWTATPRGAGTARSGTATPPGGGAGAGFTITGLGRGEHYDVRVTVTSAGGQTKQSNVVDLWTAAPTFTYPAITGKVGLPIIPARPTPPVDPKAVSGLRPAVNLPPGLRMDPATGVISGTPTAASTNTVSLEFTYAGSPNPQKAERSLDAIAYSIAGSGQEPTLGVVILVGEVGVPITPVSIASSVGNLPPGATFTSPTMCALGLSVDPSTGVISGTPTKPFSGQGRDNVYSVITGVKGDGCRITSKPVTGLNGSGRLATYGKIRTTITTPTAPRIWYTPGTVTSKQVHGSVGTAVTVPPPTLAGATSATYSTVSGSLPAGLSVDPATGAIGGVPTSAGSGIMVSLRATDAAGRSSSPVTVTFDIAAQPTTPTLTYPSPVTARVGQALSISPAGTVNGQRFALDPASLAAGIAIDGATGRVIWTPVNGQIGRRTVTVIETSPGLAPTTVAFEVTVAAAVASGGAASPTGSVQANRTPPPASTGLGGASTGSRGSGAGPAPCPAPSGTLYSDMAGSVGSTMTYAPNTTGMARPVSFRVTAGSLPGGVVLDSTYGIVTGTPTGPNGGTGPVTISAAYSDGAIRSSTVNIAVDDPHHGANYPNRVIGTVGSPTAVIPEPFDTHGKTTYSLVCGDLPAGMALDPATGIISGTPTAPVDYPVPLRIRQTDTYGSVDASLIIVAGTSPTPWIRYPEHPIASYSMPVGIEPTVSELPAGTTFRLAGKLPKGLTFNTRTGAISGTPTGFGQNRPLAITAIDGDGHVVTSTATSITVRRSAVPLRVKGRPSSTRLGAGPTVVVTSVKHPRWTTLTTRVDCAGCISRTDRTTGKVTVSAGPRSQRVTVTVTATPKQPDSMYRPHAWTRTWTVRR